MERVSEAKSVNELQGHRVLYRVRGSGELKEGVVTEFACDGKFVSLWGTWREAANVEVVAVLPGWGNVLPGRGNETEALKVGVLSDLTEANKKLQEENASLREQLAEERVEVSRIDARIQAGVPGILPSGDHDLVDEVIGLLRVTQGDRDANEKLYLECRAKLRALQGQDAPAPVQDPDAAAAKEFTEQLAQAQKPQPKAGEDSRSPQPGGDEVAPVQVLPDVNGQGLAEGV